MNQCLNGASSATGGGAGASAARGVASAPGSGNKWGDANIFSFLALAPAYLFGVLVMIALFMIGLRAIQDARR